MSFSSITAAMIFKTRVHLGLTEEDEDTLQNKILSKYEDPSKDTYYLCDLLEGEMKLGRLSWSTCRFLQNEISKVLYPSRSVWGWIAENHPEERGEFAEERALEIRRDLIIQSLTILWGYESQLSLFKFL